MTNSVKQCPTVSIIDQTDKTAKTCPEHQRTASVCHVINTVLTVLGLSPLGRY